LIGEGVVAGSHETEWLRLCVPSVSRTMTLKL
jgi:hypothetical protein